MKFYRLNPDDCCTYLILNSKNNSCVLIDPKLDYENSYLNLIKSLNGTLKAVIDTHTHSDHLSACSSLKNKTSCKYIMNENTNCTCVNKKVKNHEILNIDGIILKCIYTPGHTLDSMCIIFEDKIFTGDTLFLEYGGGRDDLPSGDPIAHYNSLYQFSKFPSHLIVYPGHNYTDSSPYSLHYLKRINPYLKFKNTKEFLRKTTQNEEAPKWMIDVISLNKTGNTDINSIEIPFEEGICQSGYIKFVKTLPLYINKIELFEKLKYSNDIILLDIRNPEELAINPMIENSINIPLKELSKRIYELEDYKDKIIVSICSSGNRALVGAKILLDSGFKNVYVLSESI